MGLTKICNSASGSKIGFANNVRFAGGGTNSSPPKELRSPRNGLQPIRHNRANANGFASPPVNENLASKVNLRKSLPVMLPSRRSKIEISSEVAIMNQNSTTTTSSMAQHGYHARNRMQPNWKQFRPELHKKTFFKGATSLTMGIESSLNLKDDTARELVKHAYRVTGQEMPEQSLEDRLKENAKKAAAYNDYFSLDDLSSDSDNGEAANATSIKQQKNASNMNLSSTTMRDLHSRGAHQQASKSLNSRAQLIEKSLSNNANLVKVMD